MLIPVTLGILFFCELHRSSQPFVVLTKVAYCHEAEQQHVLSQLRNGQASIHHTLFIRSLLLG